MADGFHIYISSPGFPSVLQTTCSAFPLVGAVVNSKVTSIFPFKTPMVQSMPSHLMAALPNIQAKEKLRVIPD